eukprot:6471683-Prymnesium_polylepis.2
MVAHNLQLRRAATRLPWPPACSLGPHRALPCAVRHVPVAMAATPAVAAVAPAMAAAPAAGAGFFQLLLAFVLGGLFFSSGVAVVGAVYALGLDNLKRATTLARLVVLRVWGLALAGLGAARAALLGETQTRWADAWETLKEGLGEAKRAAFEGVEAIKLEANLYSAVVGPGFARRPRETRFSSSQTTRAAATIPFEHARSLALTRARVA